MSIDRCATALGSLYERQLGALGQAWALGKLAPEEESYLRKLRREYQVFRKRVDTEGKPKSEVAKRKKTKKKK